jgi:hypothetical protein
MTNEELIIKLRSAKIKVILYVSAVFLSLILFDFYLANYSETISESMLSRTPFATVLFACLQLAIMLIFTYLEKILIAINQTKGSVSV